jgi:hypothetical protein
MDLLLEKQYPQKEIEKAYHILQFKNEPLELVGTAGLKRQLYPADYDFLSKIKFLKTKEMYNEFKKILDNIQQQNNLYFIEFKFQNKDESKFKIYSIDDFTLKTFYKHFKPSKIDYCKIDLIINLENTNDFKEVSVIYFIKKKNDEDITKEKYILNLEDDYKGLIKEKKYYKSLKRLFTIYKLNMDYKKINILTKFFNSNIGKLYQLKNKLEAVLILLDKFKDDDIIKKRVLMFLRNNKIKKIDLEFIPELVDDYNKIINEEGLKELKKLKIKIN